MPHVIGGSRRASQDLPDAAVPAAPDPAPILQLGLGFWASKTLLSAIEMGVFTELAERARSTPSAARRGSGCTRARRATSSTRWSRSASSSATAAATPNTPDDRPLPRPRQALLRRRHPRDGEPPPLPVLGHAHRGAAHRPAAERGQGRRRRLLRGALRRSGAPEGSSCAAMTGISHGAAHGDRREVPLEGPRDVRRRRHRRRATCRSQIALANPHLTRRRLRPAGGRADLRGVRRRARRRRPPARSSPATSSPTRCRRPTSC